MTRRMGLSAVVVTFGLLALLVAASGALAASFRPGNDPAKERVIFQDPFDFYSQWAWDNKDNPTYPYGTLWDGGPKPPGVNGGHYPTKGGTSPNYCDLVIQTNPESWYWIHQKWVGNLSPDNDCPAGSTPYGVGFVKPSIQADVDAKCAAPGEIATTRSMFATVVNKWGIGGTYTPLGIFTYDLKPQIQAFPVPNTDRPQDVVANPDAVNGTDAHPLTLIYFVTPGLGDNAQARNDNFYVELNLDGQHAPTDYIWRGNHSAPPGDPDYCPDGPYPIVCQQERILNTENGHEDADSLAWVNNHCPPLTSTTYPALAIGMLAVMDTNPCSQNEKHMPDKRHLALFDGNKWRELDEATNPHRGTALTTCPPGWGDLPSGYKGYETTMFDSGSGDSSGFHLNGGTLMIYMVIKTDKILVYMGNGSSSYCGEFDRIYQGPFNRMSMGVARGCELNTDGTCKAPEQVPALLDADRRLRASVRRFHQPPRWRAGARPTPGACCVQSGPNGGTCTDGLTSSDCIAQGGVWHGQDSLCSQFLCCPTPFADADHDGDVDQDDFGAFQLCYSGTGVTPTGCACFDHNNDGKVDVTDFTAFSNCFTEANVQWTQALTPGCVP